MSFFYDTRLEEIAKKVAGQERLSFEEGLALYRTDDLNGLGRLADSVRRKKHGRTTYYNVNRHFNHTNICVADCKFCGFYRRGRDEDSYTHSVEDAVRIAGEAVAEGATELHIVGGLNSKLPFEYYTDLFSSLKTAYPALHLKALTMVELDFFARFYKMSDEEVIEKLAPRSSRNRRDRGYAITSATVTDGWSSPARSITRGLRPTRRCFTDTSKRLRTGSTTS
jgi:aminodeoxyfutalosine synthase